MWDITAVGELLMDMAPVSVKDEDGALASAYLPKPGGAPANCIAQLAKLDKHVAMIGCVGDDFFGSRILQALKAAQIDTACVQVDGDIPTTLAFVSLNEEGDREFTFYRKPGADLRLKWDKTAEDYITQSRIFHAGTLSLVDEPARTTTMEAAKCAEKAGSLISFDPNFRLNLWSTFHDLWEATSAMLPYAHVVKISGDELVAFCHPDRVSMTEKKNGKLEYDLPAADPKDEAIEEGINTVFDQHPQLKLLAVTFGAKGSILATRDKKQFVPAFAIRAVDTTGSGDAFMGALLSCLLEAGKRDVDNQCESIPWDKLDLEAIGRFANACGAYTAMGYGAIPSLGGRKEVEAFIQDFR